MSAAAPARRLRKAAATVPASVAGLLLAAAGAGADAGAQAEPADDVVDAEFEEVKDDDKK